MKNRNCDPGCPCDFNANPTRGNCEGMAAMIVERGQLDDVNLAGVKWAFKYWWPGALHEGHGAGQPILDAAMSPEQMESLGAILSGQNGGTFYGILAEIIDTFHDPVIADIDIEIDVENRRARCVVDGALETGTERTQALGADPTDQGVQAKIPGGVGCDEAERAQRKVLTRAG